MKKLADILLFPANREKIPFVEEISLTWEKFCCDKGIPECFHGVQLSDLRGQNEFVKEILKFWIIKKTQNIVLFGGVGSGKTHAALALLKHRREKNPWSQYINASQIIEIGEKEGEKHLRAIYGECKNLVIDDLGVERCPEWNVKYLYAIVDERYSRKNQTIITTNLDESAFESIYTKRVTSRLQGQWAKINDVDWRNIL